MAAPLDDMFSCCVDPGKVAASVEVRFIDNIKGKGIFAKRSIKKGDNIFFERPLVAAQFLWNALYKYRACEFCLRALETAEENARRLSGIPGLNLPHPELCRVRPELHQACPQCQVMYCSSECRQAAADQYHRVLCLGPSQEDPDHPINKLKDAWRSMHYPPETSSIMLMARMVAVVKQAKDKAHWQKLFSHFCSRAANEEEEIAHKLLGEQFRGQLTLLHSLFKAALYDDHLNRPLLPDKHVLMHALHVHMQQFTEAIAASEHLPSISSVPQLHPRSSPHNTRQKPRERQLKWFIPEGFRSLFALVGTNGQGIGTSSLSQWVHACDALELPAQQREQLDSFIDQLYKDIEKETGDFLNCEGSGLFLLQSSCNHSCIPNAEASFPDNNFLLQLSALSDINPGEEICISYLDCCQRDRSRHSRHKILRENYLFVCSCPKCVSQMDELDVTSEEEEEEEGEAEGETEGDEMEDEMTDV